MAKEQKKKRRGAGEGSIFQRGDELWVGTLNIGYDENGKRRRRTVYGRTKKDVQEQLIKLHAQALNGTLTEPSRLTVAQYLASWLEDSVRQHRRLSTYIDYASVVRNHINPAIGGITLTKLTPLHVRGLFTAMQRKGSSARMQEKTYAVLHRALKEAVKLELIIRNVCQAVDKAKPAKKVFRALDPDEVVRFLDAAQSDRLYALYVLAIASGLRQGELLALQWENIDLKAKKLSVVHTLIELKDTLELGPPKSAKGRRLVVLPDFAVDALREHRKQMLMEGHPGPWVFCNTEGNPLRKRNLVRRSYKPILRKAKLPDIRFHDLRHTAATLLLSQDTHAKIVQERLGHSQISLTLDTYSHVLPSMQESAAKKLDDLFHKREHS